MKNIAVITLVSLVLAGLALLTGLPSHAATRCQHPDGSIIYVQGQCPPGSTTTRNVETAPTPSEQDQIKATQQASQQYKDAERLRLAREKKENKQLAADVAASKREQANTTKCERLAVRVKRAKEDEKSVTPKDAEKKRLKRTRLEEDFAMQCKN
jgi:glycerol-3-phosphate dehydrogenase